MCRRSFCWDECSRPRVTPVTEAGPRCCWSGRARGSPLSLGKEPRGALGNSHLLGQVWELCCWEMRNGLSEGEERLYCSLPAQQQPVGSDKSCESDWRWPSLQSPRGSLHCLWLLTCSRWCPRSQGNLEPGLSSVPDLAAGSNPGVGMAAMLREPGWIPEIWKHEPL